MNWAGMLGGHLLAEFREEVLIGLKSYGVNLETPRFVLLRSEDLRSGCDLMVV